MALSRAEVQGNCNIITTAPFFGSANRVLPFASLAVRFATTGKSFFFHSALRASAALQVSRRIEGDSAGRVPFRRCPRSPFGRRAVLQRGYGLRLLIFKTANNKVDLGQIRSEEIVYSRFIKIPLGELIVLSDRYRHF